MYIDAFISNTLGDDCLVKKLPFFFTRVVDPFLVAAVSSFTCMAGERVAQLIKRVPLAF